MLLDFKRLFSSITIIQSLLADINMFTGAPVIICFASAPELDADNRKLCFILSYMMFLILRDEIIYYMILYCSI